MITLLKFALITLSAAAAWEGIIALQEQAVRRQKYDMATQYAIEVGKPLLVVGGPWGRNPLRSFFNIPAHGCGDLCLDTDPGACEGCKTVVADVRNIPFPDLYFGAAMASHVLEHLQSIQDAVTAAGELYRVAEKVFILSPSKFSIAARLHYDHHLWVEQRGNAVYINPGPRYSGNEQPAVYVA
jgi:hypothetical protein